MGAQLVKEVSTKTNDVAGDGTTTAMLLAQAIIREGLKNLAAGANPIILKKGIAAAVDVAVDKIKSISKPVDNKKAISQVASISAGDASVGELIANAMEIVGKDGVITVEEGKSMTTELTTVEGMQFDRGYASAYMVTNTEKMEAVLDNPYILDRTRPPDIGALLRADIRKPYRSSRPRQPIDPIYDCADPLYCSIFSAISTVSHPPRSLNMCALW